jgi:SAM-dependent methyltransferase
MRKWNRGAVGLLLALVGFPSQAQVPATVRQEEAAREAHQRVADIFQAMGVQAGAVVADVGAGGGFLTVRLARAVEPGGRVIGVDTDSRAVERLRGRIQQEGLGNVDIVQGAEDNPHLTPDSLDAAVIVNAYHEMGAHEAMLRHLRRALKPRGRLVIVEPITEKRRHESRDVLFRMHEITLPFVEQDARDAGFRIARAEDPFTERGSDIMWLLVAVPDSLPLPTAEGKSGTVPSIRSPASRLTTSEDEASLASPDLRISFDRFKQLRERGEIAVIDVRSEEEYESGHIPGATLIPLEKIDEQLERLRKLGKPIATYCS